MKNGSNQVYKIGYPDFVVESGLQNRLIPILRLEWKCVFQLGFFLLISPAIRLANTRFRL